MTGQGLRNMHDSVFSEVQPIVRQITNLIMDVYEKGFNTGMEIGKNAKIEPKKDEEKIDFPTMDEFIDNTGEEFVLPPDVEARINEGLEKLEMRRRMEKAQAMFDAKNVILI